MLEASLPYLLLLKYRNVICESTARQTRKPIYVAGWRDRPHQPE